MIDEVKVNELIDKRITAHITYLVDFLEYAADHPVGLDLNAPPNIIREVAQALKAFTPETVKHIQTDILKELNND